MRLTPSERDRLLIFTAAQLARGRHARGLKLNVPEATAIIADAVCEAAREGKRLVEAAEAGRSALADDDVLPGVAEVVTEVKVEAVFDDGTRLVVVRSPFQSRSSLAPNIGEIEIGRVEMGHLDVSNSENGGDSMSPAAAAATVRVVNTGAVPVSITSHFHFFEVNRRLDFDRAAAYGMHLAIPAGSALRFPPGETVAAPLAPIGGDRIAVGFAGLVDGPLDAPGAKQTALDRARAEGYLGA